MALRESSTKAGRSANLALVTGAAEDDGNVAHGALLAALAEAVARWQWAVAADLRRTAAKRLGPQAASDAILVAAGFNGITRVADAIGIRLDARTAQASVALRQETGIDAFAHEGKWGAG